MDFARAIVTILSDRKENYSSKLTAKGYSKSGIYYYSNEGVTSWCDFTKMIAEYNGTTACNIHLCYSRDLPSSVKRPSYSVLDKSKVKSVFGVDVPYWTESLKKKC